MLRSKRGFYFLNKNFPTTGYPSIKCECAGPGGNVLLIKDIIARNWQNELSIPSLIKHEPSPQPTSLSFVRVGLDGRVTGYTEVRPSYFATERQNTRILKHTPDIQPTSVHGPHVDFARSRARAKQELCARENWERAVLARRVGGSKFRHSRGVGR